jgi:hypothetical protein
MRRTRTATPTVQRGRQRGYAGVSHYGGPRIRADRASEALAPRTPSATPSGAARCERKTASGMAYGRGAASHIAPNAARASNGLRIPEAARRGGHVRRGRLVPGHQAPRAWYSSFSQDGTPKYGSPSLLTNVSACVSHKFNAYFSSMTVKKFIYEGARRQRLTCPYTSKPTTVSSAKGAGSTRSRRLTMRSPRAREHHLSYTTDGTSAEKSRR